MQTEIVFRGMEPSPSVETAARRWLERLTRVYDGILSCRVVVEVPHHHHERHNAFRVAVEVGVPGQLLAVTHEPGEGELHHDVYVALSDAFRAARRQLLHYAVVRRHEVRRHEPRAW